SFPSAARSRGRDQPLLKIRRRPQSGVESSHSLWLRAVTLRDAVYRPLIAYTNSRSQDSTFSWSALFLGSARRDGRRRRPHGGNRGSGPAGVTPGRPHPDTRSGVARPEDGPPGGGRPGPAGQAYPGVTGAG